MLCGGEVIVEGVDEFEIGFVDIWFVNYGGFCGYDIVVEMSVISECVFWVCFLVFLGVCVVLVKWYWYLCFWWYVKEGYWEVGFRWKVWLWILWIGWVWLLWLVWVEEKESCIDELFVEFVERRKIRSLELLN